MDGLVGVGGKPEPGTWYWVHAVPGIFSDYATHAHLLGICVTISFRALVAQLHGKNCPVQVVSVLFLPYVF